MKTYWLFIMAFILLVLSCRKNTDIKENVSLTSNGEKLLASINVLAQHEVKKVAYSSLSDKDRFELWQAKLENEASKEIYSSEQKSIISELKNHLTVAIFKNSDEKQVFNLTWLPNWVNRSKRVFNDLQIHNIAFTIGDIEASDINTKSLTSSGSEGDSGCICALNSNFTCPSFTIGWPPSATYGPCTLQGSCISSRGCGALWDQECDGNHCPSDG